MLRTGVIIIVIPLFLLVLSSHSTVYAQKDLSFLNYTNQDYNINIKYPANWTLQETNLRPNQVVLFWPSELQEQFVLPVGVRIFVYPTSYSTIDEYMSGSSSFDKGDDNYRFINESNTLLSGLPAFNTT
jgi:hypothetical protein